VSAERNPLSRWLPEQHYTTRELAELLSVHPETVRREAARGRLRSIRVGAERRYPQSAVAEWLRDREERG
jgi:excisionase family DNA binding protein